MHTSLEGNEKSQHNKVLCHLCQWIQSKPRLTNTSKDVDKGNTQTLLVRMRASAATIEDSAEIS